MQKSLRGSESFGWIPCALLAVSLQSCGSNLPQPDSLEIRNQAALERFRDHAYENLGDCDIFLYGSFPSRAAIDAALCDLTDYFECLMQRSCDDFFYSSSNQCVIPEGCIPHEWISAFDGERPCLSDDDLAALSVGTEAVSLPPTVYVMEQSADVGCFECSPGTVTNSCFSRELGTLWDRVIVYREAGSITIDAVDQNNIVLTSATGRVDDDGSFVAVLAQAETDDFDDVRLRIGGRFSDTGFAAKFSFRASDANFKPSDFQWDRWAAYRIPGSGCLVSGSFQTCLNLGLPFDGVDELSSAAWVIPSAGFVDEDTIDLLASICRTWCQGFECEACLPCAEAIVEDPCR